MQNSQNFPSNNVPMDLFQYKRAKQCSHVKTCDKLFIVTLSLSFWCITEFIPSHHARGQFSRVHQSYRWGYEARGKLCWRVLQWVFSNRKRTFEISEIASTLVSAIPSLLIFWAEKEKKNREEIESKPTSPTNKKKTIPITNSKIQEEESTVCIPVNL